MTHQDGECQMIISSDHFLHFHLLWGKANIKTWTLEGTSNSCIQFTVLLNILDCWSQHKAPAKKPRPTITFRNTYKKGQEQRSFIGQDLMWHIMCFDPPFAWKRPDETSHQLKTLKQRVGHLRVNGIHLSSSTFDEYID